MSDGLFHIIEGAQVVLCSRGVYRQAKLYRRGDEVFAGWGTGYIRLGASGGTSKPEVSYLNLDVPEDTVVLPGALGRLTVARPKLIDSAA